MNMLSAVLYWVAVAIWMTVLITVIINYVRNPRAFGATRLLLVVVIIDTVRNIVENVYFGSYWGGQFGLFDPAKVGFLGNPTLMMIPKALNIVAGSFVLGLLLLRWLPESVRERAEAERRIAAAERDAMGFAAVMDRASMPILVLDAQHDHRPVVFANRAFLANFNRTPEEVIGKTWRYQEAANPAGPEVAALHAAITETRHTVSIIDCRRPDGSTYQGRISVMPIADGAGNVTLLTVMCEGVVEPVVAPNADDAHGARDRIVGQLAGSVAHDFNNLLSVMLSSLETARGMLSPNSPAAPAVDLTVRAARRSSQLARRLMDYSRNRATDNEIVDLVALIDSLQPLLARAVTGRARLMLDLPEGPVICKLDAGRLEDTLINLCLNARDALENGGNVRVSVGVENSDPAQAVITVADTGQGMPPEVLARVFERHFTTKPEGQGTGLGLASVKDFVEAEGGVIAIDSTPGKGTTVRLALPLAA